MIIRKATASEISFFENSLYPLQDRILQLLSDEKFYLTGGTALSRCYFEHRYSEDLDFFYDGYRNQHGDFERDFVIYSTKIRKEFQFQIVVNEKYFKRLFVMDNDISLKIEFIYEPYPRIGNYIRNVNYFIDTKENIAVNKITALYNRKTIKDYYDLFFLLREFDLKNLTKLSENKMVPLDYEGAVISLRESFFEGEVLSKNPIEKEDFLNFSKYLISTLINYAGNS